MKYEIDMHAAHFGSVLNSEICMYRYVEKGFSCSRG